MKNIIYAPLVRLFGLSVFIAFLSAVPVAAAVNNSITGFVFNSSRQPVADIYVELQGELYTTLGRVKTTGSGFYSFRGLREGRYNIKVLPYGTNYEEQMRAVSLISVSAVRGSGGVSEQVDFYLRLKKTSGDGPLAAPGVVFAQEIPNNARKLYEEGVKLLGDKKDKEAFEKIKSALEIFPDYFLALDRLGTEYVVRGFYRPAYVLLKKAVAVNPKSFSSRFGYGLALYRLEQYDQAIENLRQAVRLYDESPRVHLWLGIALLQKGDLPGAEKSLLEANEKSGEKSPDVRWQLARLYKEQGKLKEAADELELYLKYSTDLKNEESIRKMIETLRGKTTAQ